jgi:hypothetical protein
MARNGAGTFSLPQAPFVSGTVISSTAVNSDFSDIATALTQSIAVDGQTPITANLPMTGFGHTNVSNAATRTMYASAGQVQDSSLIWCGTAGGTADALTLTPTPAITAYTAGQTFRFTAGASPNTGAATVAVSGLAAKNIYSSGSALAAGAIEAGKQYEIVYDGTQFQIRPYSLTALRIVGSSYQDVAANTTTNLAALNASTVAINLTGNATIDTFSGLSGLPELRVKLGGAAINITNGANISVPGGNYTGAANDTLVLRPTGNTTAEVVDIMRANGTSVAGSAAASETVAGIIEIATQAETTTGTDDTRAITPKKLTEFAPATATVDTGADTVLFIDATDSKVKKGSFPTATIDTIHLRNEQASNTAGGSTTASAWTKATINTEVVDTGGHCSISSSVITLAAGTYEFTAVQQFVAPNRVTLRFRNTTDSTNAVIGQANVLEPDPSYTQGIPAYACGRFTIAGSKSFELQYYCTNAQATVGLGAPNAAGGLAEVYLDIWMKKVA